MAQINNCSHKQGNAQEEILKWSQNFCEACGHKPLAYVRSYGCQQNVSDGEKIKGQLLKVGFDFTQDKQQAQLIILNTCAVRENAQDRVFGNLGEIKKLKENNKNLIVGVCGCMAQQEHIAQKIKQAYRQVDLVFGTFAGGDLYTMLWTVIAHRVRVFNISQNYTDINEGFVQLRDDKVKACVPIMYGCNNFCTYCIVPYVRGRERSRRPENVIKEVKELVEQGYKEITLLGQNVNSYEYGFASLLRDINEIEGDFRVRFMSSHPKDAGEELINAIFDCEKICNHLHLPVQSGCDEILKKMNRKYTVEDYMKIIESARKRDKDFSFTTDIIVGFPGESYEQFRQTAQLLKKVKFDNIYSFVYSKREGTAAAKMEDNISSKQKGMWLRELLMEQREISQQHLSRFIGKTLRVLADGEGKKGEGWLTGKCDENIIVEFKGEKRYIGQFIQVRITKAMNWALQGEVLCEGE